ncbi:MAG: hypothetical protein SVO01_05010 [Thermotogota bacterium]|nr:hypothetical protein [Thermotogota bacterium]
MIKVRSKACISDIKFRYNAKIEVYLTLNSDMPKLSEMPAQKPYSASSAAKKQKLALTEQFDRVRVEV